MTDFTKKIAAGGDDGYCETSGSGYSSNAINLIIGNAGGSLFRSFLRFTNITIPKNSEISSCVVALFCYLAGSSSGTNLEIKIEDADNPSAPVSGADVISRSLGSATSWNNEQAWSVDQEYLSDDFSSEMENHLSRSGWSSGNSLTVHIVPAAGASGYRQAHSYDHGNSSFYAELRISYTEPSELVESGIGFSGQIDAQNMSDSIDSGLGFSDVFGAFNTSGYIENGVGFNGSIEAALESPNTISSEVGLNDEFISQKDGTATVSDDFGLSSVIDAFNWSKWLASNKDRAIERFYFTLSGTPDGVADIEIPISSFQARKRSGESTYLSVIVPDFSSFSAAIVARSNGEMTIELAYILDGEQSVREKIITVDLEEIAPYEGPQNRSIGLSGHKTQTFVAKIATLERPTYKSSANGRRLFRFAKVDPYLNPGDTVIIGEDSFTVDYVLYIVSSGYKMMEIREIA
jgi:hypothetical protein